MKKSELRKIIKEEVSKVLSENTEEQYPVGTEFKKPDGNQIITILGYENGRVQVQSRSGNDGKGSGFKHKWPASELSNIIKKDNMTIVKEGIRKKK
tara:strand:- start:1550 stop:1837 length:288 start_codon:yes stop_codon:yes gene_type:complete